MSTDNEYMVQSYTNWYTSLLRQREEAREYNPEAVAEISAQIATVKAKLDELTGNA